MKQIGHLLFFSVVVYIFDKRWWNQDSVLFSFILSDNPSLYFQLEADPC